MASVIKIYNKEYPNDIIELDLGYNNIKYIDGNIFNLTKLKILNLAGNNLIKFDCSNYRYGYGFQLDCDKMILEEMYLQNNNLINLPNDFQYAFPNLKVIHLEYNKITDYKELFNNLPASLEEIYLNGNTGDFGLELLLYFKFKNIKIIEYM
jgi:Leucine-rich repeat (LRR) protein